MLIIQPKILKAKANGTEILDKKFTKIGNSSRGCLLF